MVYIFSNFIFLNNFHFIVTFFSSPITSSNQSSLFVPNDSTENKGIWTSYSENTREKNVSDQ